MPNFVIKPLSVFKLIAFCITLLLVLFYQSLPKRELLIHPMQQHEFAVSLDSEVGGNSEFIWQDKQKYAWDCVINPGAPYPYCGLSLFWSKDLTTTIDFSQYTHLNLQLSYQGPTRYIRLFIRDAYHVDGARDLLKSAKFNNITILPPTDSQQISIALDELSVAEWWINDFNVPLEDRQPSISKAIALGIDIPYPVSLGHHMFRLNEIKLVGDYFSKEALYISIIVFWSALLLGEMLLNYISLQRRLREGTIRLSELAKATEHYRQQAHTDKLTNIANRNGLAQVIDRLSSKRLLSQYALLIVDIDHFKEVNDTWSHAEGDIILHGVAELIQECIRSYDYLARWGGEEFVLLGHCANTQEIQQLAEKIRAHIQQAPFCTPITVSIGGAQLSNGSFDQAFLIADQALYRAKSGGRNKVVVV